VGKISDQNNDDVQPPFLDLVLLHDYGYVCDLKWCPYGGYEKETLFETKVGINLLNGFFFFFILILMFYFSLLFFI